MQSMQSMQFMPSASHTCKYIIPVFDSQPNEGGSYIIGEPWKVANHEFGIGEIIYTTPHSPALCPPSVTPTDFGIILSISNSKHIHSHVVYVFFHTLTTQLHYLYVPRADSACCTVTVPHADSARLTVAVPHANSARLTVTVPHADSAHRTVTVWQRAYGWLVKCIQHWHTADNSMSAA
jgi:hypothetical protein